MSRTSTALKRLGVAGVAVATIGAGVPVFFAGSANAAVTTPTGISLSPDSDTAAIGTCNAFTATVTPAPGTGNTAVVDVTISQTGPSGITNTGPNIGFCNPGNAANGGGTNPQPSGTNGTLADPTAGTGTNTTSQGGGAGTPISCSNGTNATPTTGTTTTCNAEFVTDSAGVVTFGVTSDTTGNMNVQAYLDNNNNNVQNTGEPQDTSVKTWVAANASGVDCSPETFNGFEGDSVDYSCTVTTSGGSTISGEDVNYVITAGPDKNLNPQSCGTTNNVGVATCTITNSGGPGNDSITFYVDTANGGVANGPQTGEPSDDVTATFSGESRNIACTPKSETVTSNTIASVTCIVTDVNGNRVGDGQAVRFTETGPGAFRNGTSTLDTTTNNNGVVTAEVTTAASETGQETITAALGDLNNNFGSISFDPYSAANNDECGETANNTNSGVTPAPTTAGNCTDAVTKNWVSGSPSPSPSTSTSPSAGGRGTLSTSTPDIQPNETGILTATGLTSNAAYELRCYSRPSTDYFTARSATTSASGTSLEFRILPGTNTRCYVRPAGNESLASNQIVINVHTTLSLSAVRTGVRTYIFQGRNLPRRSGQLITLYRISNGQEIRTSNLVTDASGIFRVTRTFTGNGTFQFRVRTSQTLTNAPGASVAITVTVH